jgi:threonine/homoserine/homoserine lactone efflux protein
MLFIRGLLIGLAIAAPVGPIGILCIRRTLQDGWLVGLLTGLGAATADGTYGAIAAFGLTVVIQVLTGKAIWLQLVGGLFLGYLGIRTLLSVPSARAASNTARGMVGAYISTVGLTLTNPLTIFSFFGIFAGLGLARTGESSTLAALVLVLGVTGGSSLWWLTLSSGVAIARQRVNELTLRIINLISGSIIFIFGIVALIGVIVQIIS